MFMVWVYTRELVVPPQQLETELEGVEARTDVHDDARLVSAQEHESSSFRWNELDVVDLYLFGRKHHIDALANQCIHLLFTENLLSSQTCSLSAVRRAWDAGPWSTLLCDYLVNEAAYLQQKSSTPPSLDICAQYPAHYIFRIKEVMAVEIEDDQIPYPAKTASKCRYHIHHGSEEQQECAKEASLLPATPCGNRYISDIYRILTEVGTVLIDESGYPVTIHGGLLVAAVEYFRGAFSHAFAESKLGDLSLSDENISVFLMAVHWLYTTDIHTRRPGEYYHLRGLVSRDAYSDVATEKAPGQRLSNASDDSENVFQSETTCRELNHDILLDLYVFSDRRNADQLRNDVMSTIIRNFERKGTIFSAKLSRITTAFEMLPANSHLRKYLIHEALTRWDAQFAQEHDLNYLPSDFLGEVVRARLAAGDQNSPHDLPWRQSLCSFHDHEIYHGKWACRGKWRRLRRHMKRKLATRLPAAATDQLRQEGRA